MQLYGDVIECDNLGRPFRGDRNVAFVLAFSNDDRHTGLGLDVASAYRADHGRQPEDRAGPHIRCHRCMWLAVRPGRCGASESVTIEELGELVTGEVPLLG